MIAVVVLYALLALTFILAKNALMYSSPCFLIGFRMLIAGAILLIYQRYGLKQNIRIPFADWSLFFKTSLFHIYFAFILEFWALQYVSALKTTIIYSSTPFIAALLSYALLGERLSLQKGIGIVVGLAGLIPVIMLSSTGLEAVMELGHISLPEVVLFAAVVSAAYAWFLVKQLMEKGYHLLLINGTAMLIGGILSMSTALTVEGMQTHVSDWPHFLLWVGLLIIVANIIVYNMYGMLLRTYTITFLTFAGFLTPCFGALFEWLFTGTILSWHYFASIIFITTGLYIFYCDELKS